VFVFDLFTSTPPLALSYLGTSYLLGSVTEQVVRRSPVPVHAVRADAD